MQEAAGHVEIIETGRTAEVVGDQLQETWVRSSPWGQFHEQPGCSLGARLPKPVPGSLAPRQIPSTPWNSLGCPGKSSSAIICKPDTCKLHSVPRAVLLSKTPCVKLVGGRCSALAGR